MDLADTAMGIDNMFQYRLDDHGVDRCVGEGQIMGVADQLAARSHGGVGFDQLKSRYRDAQSLPPPERSQFYRARLRSQAMLGEALLDAIRRHRLDAVVLPYSLDGASPIGQKLGRTNSLASHAGLPSVVVPAGCNAAGLPIAAQFIAEPYRDATLLQLAHLVEQAAGGTTLPAATPPLPGEHI